jgi:sugar/nucleoside kinase (ribokinase family)
MVKINQDELEFLAGSRDLQAADTLRTAHDVPLLIVTLDSRGAYFTYKGGNKIVPGFQIKFVEATGAGDGFNAGMITGLLPFIKRTTKSTGKGGPDVRTIIDGIDIKDLVEIVRHANAIGALTCTRAGAIPALPTADEVSSFVAEMATQASH